MWNSLLGAFLIGLSIIHLLELLAFYFSPKSEGSKKIYMQIFLINIFVYTATLWWILLQYNF